MPVGHTEICVGLSYRAPLCLVAVQQLGGSCAAKNSSKLPRQVVRILQGYSLLRRCYVQLRSPDVGFGFLLGLDLQKSLDKLFANQHIVVMQQQKRRSTHTVDKSTTTTFKLQAWQIQLLVLVHVSSVLEYRTTNNHAHLSQITANQISSAAPVCLYSCQKRLQAGTCVLHPLPESRACPAVKSTDIEGWHTCLTFSAQ